ncbi:FAD-dependent oxidoreductase [Bradyrhizobium sp. WYCCWR 13022]|uniref:FAD-dependent oxidoreductase n=1 Tax=unclassified Bradyrhizobium TaxID=2631580 RepID=UPI00263BE5CA|nr:FAD-dependent oxidoreductase [Bradyrhizobium sp. WYCCWR 13022]MDN4984319.1 FAD-dependent oxidoreductase [Bradyrhizobium sp. WYCCWR 13022]
MDSYECDVLVVGSGAAGLTTAIACREFGQDVLLVEKTQYFGGTTAFSAGVIWVPNSPQAAAAGIVDSEERASKYLECEAGNLVDRDRMLAFLRWAPEMLRFIEAKTDTRFDLLPTMPDYHPTLPGASGGGRTLRPRVFDGRLLGAHFANVRPPLKTMTIFGGMMVGSGDIPHLYNLRNSASSVWYATKMFGRYCYDRLGHSRGTRLTNGNALVASLLSSALKLKIPMWRSSPLARLIVERDRIRGAIVTRDNREVLVRVRKAVVLATGGFSANRDLRQPFDQEIRKDLQYHSLPPSTNTGDGFQFATAIGGAIDGDVHQYAAWAPVSEVPQPDGSRIGFPHFSDRAKPGFIVVDRRGNRFASEALPYHDFVPQMIAACQNDENVEAFIIADHRSVRRWGMGAAPPWPLSITRFLRTGYLKKGKSIADLARLCGISAAGLEATVEFYNGQAGKGVDASFNKGADAYERIHGAKHDRGEHPNIAPICDGPFYALRIIPGDIGTFAGLKTNADAQVIGDNGEPLQSLYAVGNDASSIMRGTYPGAGVTIGPAMTFAYIVAKKLSTALTDV